MLRERFRPEPPPVFITDTGMFCGDIVRSCRAGGQITSLLWAIHFDGARLYLPKRVVEEVTSRLHRRAPDEATFRLATQRFVTYYLSRAIVVDEIPEDWAQSDPRIQALASRDPSDLPAARLSVALDAFLLSEDRDLIDLGLADSKWLPLAHAAANDAEYTLALTGAYLPSAATLAAGEAAWKGYVRLSPAMQLVAVATLLAVGYWAITTGRARHVAQRVSPALTGAGEALLPAVAEVLERGRRAEGVLRPTPHSDSSMPSRSELIARVLARCGSHDRPILAEDVARQLAGPPLRERTQLVRAELLAHPRTFTQVRRGRFALGRPVGETVLSLPHDEVADFLRRSHREAGQKPTWTFSQ